MQNSGNNSAPAVSDGNNIALTIRILMQGKEVGSIIGKKGDIVKRFREESSAKINISDGSSPERIVTINGNKEAIYKAFTLICKKFEEDLNNLLSPGTVPRPPITFRLVVPASQCGSLIGKGGAKIKEIREMTGASIQVASEMLPNSTERTVTVSGSSETVIQCIYQICCIMSESPPKGVTVPYTPLKTVAVPGVQAIPALVPPNQALIPTTQLTGHATQGGKVGIPVSLGGPVIGGGILNPAALALLAGQARPPPSHQTHEMTVPNELIGCIIGKGGSKVAEIRQLSGAMIRISNCEDKDAPPNMDRTITISGNCESVALAQYLINMSMEVFRANLIILEEQQKAAQQHLHSQLNGSTSPAGHLTSPHMSAPPPQPPYLHGPPPTSAALINGGAAGVVAVTTVGGGGHPQQNGSPGVVMDAAQHHHHQQQQSQQQQHALSAALVPHSMTVAVAAQHQQQQQGQPQQNCLKLGEYLGSANTGAAVVSSSGCAGTVSTSPQPPAPPTPVLAAGHALAQPPFPFYGALHQQQPSCLLDQFPTNHQGCSKDYPFISSTTTGPPATVVPPPHHSNNSHNQNSNNNNSAVHANGGSNMPPPPPQQQLNSIFAANNTLSAAYAVQPQLSGTFPPMIASPHPHPLLQSFLLKQSHLEISMETASMGGMAGFQYITPNHIIKTSIQ